MVTFAILTSPILAQAGKALETTGVIEGSVRIGRKPAPYVNVVLLQIHRGALTDETGSFRILDVPPGRWTIRANAIGVPAVERSVNLSPGRANRVILQLADRDDPRFIARHRVRPNPEIVRRIRQTTSVRLFRIEKPDSISMRNATSTFWPFRSTEVTAPPLEKLEALASILEDPKTYGNRLDVDRKLCIFDPGVGLQLSGPKGPTRVLICMHCYQMGIKADPALRALIDFDDAAPAVREWVEELMNAAGEPSTDR